MTSIDNSPPSPPTSRTKAFPVWRVFAAVVLLLFLIAVVVWGYAQWQVAKIVAQLKAHGADVYTCCPLFENAPESLEWLSRSVSVVKFSSEAVHEADIEILARCPDLVIVKFEGAPLTDAHVELLAEVWQRGQLRKLSVVDFSGTRITNASLPAVARMASLEAIGLAETDIDQAGLKNLASLPNLTGIGLSGCPISGDLGSVLASFPVLRQINLSNIKLDITTIQSLRHCRADRIRLANTNISDESLAILSAMKHWYSLDLSGTEISNEGLELLAELPHLRSLEIPGTRVTIDGVHDLLRSKPRLSIILGVEPDQYPIVEQLKQEFPAADLMIY